MKGAGLRVLVIGGTRFIGRYGVEQLIAAGCQVAVFHRGETEAAGLPPIPHIHGDRAELAEYAREVAAFGPDVVLDMVPMTAQDAATVIETVSDLAERVVVISSQDVYRAYDVVRDKDDGPPQPVPLGEHAELRRHRYPYRRDVAADHPLADYDKILVEERYRGAAGPPATILRLPAVYGPHDAQHRTAPYLRRMLDGRGTILVPERMAGWRWTRSYVEDVASAIAMAVTDEAASGLTFNVGDVDAMSEREWIEAIADAAGWDGEIRVVSDAALPEQLRAAIDPGQDLVVDSSLIRSRLGYSERIDRTEAMRRTVAWEGAQAYDPIDYGPEDEVIGSSGR
jgi:nucleoside-diphosphate-sugar epimerase